MLENSLPGNYRKIAVVVEYVVIHINAGKVNNRMSHSQTRSFPVAGETVWQALLRAVAKAGWKIADSRENSCLEVRTGMSALCLLGLNIKIALSQAGLNLTEVVVQADVRGQLLDYGLPVKETQRLFGLLEEELASSCFAPAPAGSFAVANTCAACGETLKPGAKFCAGCGAPAAQASPSVPLCARCGVQTKPGAKFCAACGAPTKPGAKFCAGCGHSL